MSEAKRLRELEVENARRKKLLAGSMLWNEVINDVLKKVVAVQPGCCPRICPCLPRIARVAPGYWRTLKRPKPLFLLGIPAFLGCCKRCSWWLWVDSNHRPQHYECCALTG